jgi:DNA-3-methyladenine glycosylase
VDLAQDGVSFVDGETLWLERGAPVSDREVRRTRRIGVEYAGAWASKRYRFVVRGHPAVSGPKALR